MSHRIENQRFNPSNAKLRAGRCERSNTATKQRRHAPQDTVTKQCRTRGTEAFRGLVGIQRQNNAVVASPETDSLRAIRASGACPEPCQRAPTILAQI